MRPVRNTFPINLIDNGNPAIIVGFGKVGKRKADLLRRSGIPMRIIAPEVNRAFAPGDTVGAAFVFACTSDKHVNRAVLEDARANHVPCCVCDMNWADGDFITPAILHHADATIAVSTSGASCTTARYLRNQIAAALSTSVRLSLCPLSSFPVDPFSLKGVDELVKLVTCHRSIAVIFGSYTSSACTETGLPALAKLIRIAAGLESPWVGESHIVSQIKSALADAEESGTLGPHLRATFDVVFRISKQVRHALEGIVEVREVEHVAVEYLNSHLPPDACIAILGSGQVGNAVADLLKGRNVVRLHHGDAIPRCDALVCALQVREPCVTSPVGTSLVLDLGAPANCSPAVNAVSLDALKNWRRIESGTMAKINAIADSIIETEIGAMAK